MPHIPFRARGCRRQSFVVKIVKVPFRDRDKRAELWAFALVVAILAIGAIAKFDAAASLFRSVH
jgi:hypothetical protein